MAIYASLFFIILFAPLTSIAGEKIDPKFHVIVEGDTSKPVLVGMTNLPEGTELLITISRSKSGYRAQDKTSVQKGGTFKTTSFSNRGKPLTAGEHQVEVLMPLPRVQPRNVQEIIGMSGENLSGDLVGKGVLGITVEYHTSFRVAGTESKNIDEAALREAYQRRLKWIRQSCISFFGSIGIEFNKCYDESVEAINK